MKKLLAILAAVGISITGASSAIACGKDSTVECPPCEQTPERITLQFLIDYTRKTLDDEVDPEIKLCTRVERSALASDIIIGSGYLVDFETPPSKINELNIKFITDHNTLWLKITQCSAEKNTKLAMS